ncbi:CpsD/CapB family tyrosine-protein kinase [Sphingomonas sp. BN140010]|uniref:CpsD/CapB family tyrosine-protein kinase n=1 Tax=Sphingomonas arvum TaxID=2992113 RepID=A0ABT3JCA6_9SPHN|nr:CpsD/CapB family tyrosine-protein kinase [Sphingomonas sp. BN140010]MCW3796549.1 CpsD/CapB family tyrosine-protein kinase [Sphingomonas sp. BN140010]
MRLSTDTLTGTVDERGKEPHGRLVPINDAGRAPTPFVPAAGRGRGADDGPLGSQLRDLLTSLNHGSGVHHTPRRIVIAGVHTGEEASFLASSLAMTCARSGYRALLVDANIPHPMVHRNLGLSNKFGLSTLLTSSDPPHALPQATAVPNLAAITIGPECANITSLLTREQLFHRLQPLAGSFDYILVDCADLTPDLIGRVSAGADNVVVTVKQHVSSVREISSVVESLRHEGVSEPAILMVE